MKHLIIIGLLLLFAGTNTFYGQDSEMAVDSIAMKEKEAMEVEKIVEDNAREAEKVERDTKRAERELKKMNREVKQQKKLAGKISSTQRSIDKGKRKIEKAEKKLRRDQARGKLSPVDIQKLHSKIANLQSDLVKDEDKLRKLIRRQ